MCQYSLTMTNRQEYQVLVCRLKHLPFTNITVTESWLDILCIYIYYKTWCVISFKNSRRVTFYTAIEKEGC